MKLDYINAEVARSKLYPEEYAEFVAKSKKEMEEK